MSLEYRKKRIKNLSKKWKGSLANDLIMQWKIPDDLFKKFQFAIGLYISKSMHFTFSESESEIVKLINKNRNNRLNIITL